MSNLCEDVGLLQQTLKRNINDNLKLQSALKIYLVDALKEQIYALQVQLISALRSVHAFQSVVDGSQGQLLNALEAQLHALVGQLDALRGRLNALVGQLNVSSAQMELQFDIAIK